MTHFKFRGVIPSEYFRIFSQMNADPLRETLPRALHRIPQTSLIYP
jgi:hypothetical protein